MKTFTDQQITEALEKVVKGNEDYIYDSGRPKGDGCFYGTTEGEPSCIVGHVIHALSPEAFEKIINAEVLDSFVVRGAIRYADGEFNISTEARDALEKAQEAQDGGATWGTAYERYAAKMAEVA